MIADRRSATTTGGTITTLWNSVLTVGNAGRGQPQPAIMMNGPNGKKFPSGKRLKRLPIFRLRIGKNFGLARAPTMVEGVNPS